MVRRILVADDDNRLAKIVASFLEQRGYDLDVASDGATALARMGTFKPDVLITDVQMPALDGFTLLKQAQESYPNCAVVVMTGYGSVEDAGKAKQLGALHYLQKPFPPEDLINVLSRLEKGARPTPKPGDRFPEMIGESPAMREVFSRILQVANTDLSVLIQGETGTGKELVATAIHRLSFRNRGRFVVVNCATLETELFESELFGHTRGAFTGATSAKDGLMAAASGGTLFLDEIGEITKKNQAKLLRALETGEIRRIGDTRPRQVDVRFVAATNAPLRRAAAEGDFRSDLFFRLAAFTITLPPLRDRREDIPALARSFLARAARDARRDPPTISEAAEARLVSYSWPGNVRELRNVLRAAEVACANDELGELRPDHITFMGANPLQAVDPMAHPGYRGSYTTLAGSPAPAAEPAAHPGAGHPVAGHPVAAPGGAAPLEPPPQLPHPSAPAPAGSLALPAFDFEGNVPYRELREDLIVRFDRAYFRELLTLTRGNISKAARIAGLDRKRLREKLTAAELSADDFR